MKPCLRDSSVAAPCCNIAVFCCRAALYSCSAAAFCCWANWISFSAALTTGSGIGAEAVSRENNSAKLLKFARAILKFGKAHVAAAAPTSTKTDNDATIAGFRLDRMFSVTGCSSSCVSLLGASACGSCSSVSATCVRLRSRKEPSR